MITSEGVMSGTRTTIERGKYVRSCINCHRAIDPLEFAVVIWERQRYIRSICRLCLLELHGKIKSAQVEFNKARESE
jgi:hypothetical protein